MADEQPKPEPDKWLPRLKVAGLVLAWCGWLVAVVLALREGKPVPAPPPVWEPQPVGAMGWVNDPQSVAVVVNQLPNPFFADTPAGKAVMGDEDVFLWDACRQVTGGLLPPRNQRSVGSCVGFGTSSAIEHLMCVIIVQARRAGQPPPLEYRDLVQEICYGGSRVEIGGGRIRGDGSVGAWAARFVTQYGTLDRGVHTVNGRAFDLTAYTEARCREYGARGVPDDLEPLVKRHPVKGVSQVKSWADVKRAIQQGYPIAVCSDRGFTTRRDADGFCRPSGTWNHCMAIVGVQGGRRPGGFILNSWGGDSATGPVGKGDPSPAGFWADADVIDGMVKQGDSWAFSDAVGFPARELNWEVRRGVFPAKRYAHRIEVAPWESLSSPAW